jgi:DNA-binding GntR family transcriptional regulator
VIVIVDMNKVTERASTVTAGGMGEVEARLSSGIRRAILAGDYAPGQRLIEAELCEEFGASRFMVRVALQELTNDGLIEMQRNKGARVRTVPVEEALEIVEVRMALEALSAARAARLATPADAAELQDIAERMRRAVEVAELLTYSELNARLHDTIQRISANGTCTRTLERLRGQVVRHQFALSLQPGRPAVSLVQHEQIVAAIVAGDPEAADQAMRRHLISVAEELSGPPLQRVPLNLP